jgi:hypothetical protein
MLEKLGLSLPTRRDKTIIVRIDPQLYDQATDMADAFSVAAVMRALLRTYVRGAVEPPLEGLSKELQWPPRRPRKPRRLAK